MIKLRRFETYPNAWLYAVAIIVSLLLGVLLATQHLKNEPTYINAQWLPATKTVPDFDLRDQSGSPIGSTFWMGKWSLVFFGFASCPDVCPLELQKFSSVWRTMGDQTNLRVVFVSVDPERDSLARLQEYVTFFHPEMIALTGENSTLAQFANFFGAYYERSVIMDTKVIKIPAGSDMPEGAGDAYQVNHAARLFIVNPEGAYSGSFSPPFNVKILQHDVRLMMADP